MYPFLQIWILLESFTYTNTQKHVKTKLEETLLLPTRRGTGKTLDSSNAFPSQKSATLSWGSNSDWRSHRHSTSLVDNPQKRTLRQRARGEKGLSNVSLWHSGTFWQLDLWGNNSSRIEIMFLEDRRVVRLSHSGTEMVFPFQGVHGGWWNGSRTELGSWKLFPTPYKPLPLWDSVPSSIN